MPEPVGCDARQRLALSPYEKAMGTFFRLLCVLPLSICPLTLAVANDAAESASLASPDGQLQATFRLDEQGRPVFDVAYRDIPIVVGSLGLEFGGSGELRENLKVVGIRRASRDGTYTIAVGKASAARDHHHELIVSLEEAPPPHRKLDIALRAFDDGNGAQIGADFSTVGRARRFPSRSTSLSLSSSRAH